MPELKHNFLKGRMNKDLDERLVPNGEYRDALNIEVSTSEDSDVGTVQTTKGNIKISNIPIGLTTKCIGEVLDEKNDKLYWLISEAGYRPFDGENTLGTMNPAAVLPLSPDDYFISDLIMEYDSKTETVKPIVVDTFETACLLTGYDPNQGEGDWISLNSGYWTTNMSYTIYPGMEISMTDQNGNETFPTGTVVVDVNPSQFQVKLSNRPTSPINTPFTNYKVKFQNFNRALNFLNKKDINGKFNIITGINIIDDMMFWTDDNSEPKKINITKCKKEREINPYLSGVSDSMGQSLLVVSDNPSGSNTLEIAKGNLYSPTALVPLKEEHTAVVKRSPEKSLKLEMRNSPREGNLYGQLDYSNPSGAIIDSTTFPNQTITQPSGTINPFNPFWDTNTLDIIEGRVWINFGGPDSRINQISLDPNNINGWPPGVPIYEVDDVLIIKVQGNISIEEIIRAKVTDTSGRLFGGYEIEILSYSPTIDATNMAYEVELEQPAPLFEFKFPRFSYRYKYEDGEYSAFAPFSEIAFLPEKFEYLPKKGYNLGMTNNLRKLVIKDFVDDKLLPKDVLSIDILYKESNSPNVYSVKTITKNDFEWHAISDDYQGVDVNGSYVGTRGYLKITSEMIHATLPSNQMLRPWDNVPRKALSQEITGNRLVYGNYLQNYNMRDVNDSKININLELSFLSKHVGRENGIGFHYSPEERDEKNAYRYDPSKSVKTLRTYQLGVVYRDKYGRETPVFSNNVKRNAGDSNTASLYLEKSFAEMQTKLRAQIKHGAPEWAKSFKFFVKETSNEYYNLAMDRWYDAEDDNVWLSFPSSERNKVDIDTFLIFKKEKDTNTAIKEPGRYKILAIENEAPLFVKTTEQSFGRLSDGDISTNGTAPSTVFRTNTGSNSTGFPRPNASFMYVAATSFGFDDGTNASSEGMGWHRSLLQEGRGNLYMRMRTPGLTSDWYKITSISLEQNVGINGAPMYRIDIDAGVFGQDMSITSSSSTNITNATIAAGLSLEIKQNITENKPEFEGRFFVKIYKDQLITEKLIRPTLDSIEYSVRDAREIGYVFPSHYYPNDVINVAANEHTVNTGSSGVDNNNSNFTPWQGSLGDAWTSAGGDWRSGNTPGGPGQETSANFIHRLDQPSYLNPDGATFWNAKGSSWFIDRCIGWRYQGSPFSNGSPRVLASMGKGIWNSGRNVQLSFTNIGDDTTGNYTLFDWVRYTQEVNFITALKSPGTLFRFREDPDQHVYITETMWSMSNGIGTGNGVIGETLWNWGVPLSVPVSPGYDQARSKRHRFQFQCVRLDDRSLGIGQPGGPHNARYSPTNDPANDTYFENTNQPGVPFAAQGTCSDVSFNGNEQACLDAGGTWTSSGLSNPTTTAPGIRHDFDGPAGYKPINTSNNVWETEPGRVTLQLLEPITRGASLENASTNPAIWETEPKEDVGMDIYHEVGQVYHVELNEETNEHFAPIGSVVECWRSESSNYLPSGSILIGGAQNANPTWAAPIRVKSWDDNIVTLEDDNGNEFVNNLLFTNEHIAPGDHLSFKRSDGSRTSTIVEAISGAQYLLRRDIHDGVKDLPWFNCYSFGNGVESDRVRDDYNQVTIDNGPKASTTLDEPYLEERRGSGLIYSGIYNSISGINNLNQFIQAEKITKDLNPTYGSIQKLHTRDTDLITLCEDKVLKVQANKDALFNADGNSNVTATSNVLGQTIPFVGEFGISKNPESFVSENFRAYFTDKQRGVVIRLSRDGITPISEAGMKDWFADNLPSASSLVGSYDKKKSTYNLTINSNDSKTISYSEKSKGWTSFKSFIQETGVSLNNKYYTFKDGNIWRHHADEVDRNNFYDTQQDSSVTVLFNEQPETVKGFLTLNYEGSQAKITQDLIDPDYYNNIEKDGWFVSSMITNLQETENLEFKGKEDKWFSNIKGVETELGNLDTKEFSVQGIGNVTSVTTEVPVITPTKKAAVQGCTDSTQFNYNPLATIDDGTCQPFVYGCTGGTTQFNYNPLANIDDGSCVPIIYGCTDPTATNYYGGANTNDGSCIYCISGCMDPQATNYNPLAVCDCDGNTPIENYGSTTCCQYPRASFTPTVTTTTKTTTEPSSTTTTKISETPTKPTETPTPTETQPTWIQPPQKTPEIIDTESPDAAIDSDTEGQFTEGTEGTDY